LVGGENMNDRLPEDLEIIHQRNKLLVKSSVFVMIADIIFNL